MSDPISTRIAELDIPYSQLNDYFREACQNCGHQRVAHDEFGVCEGINNQPCEKNCEKFVSV